MKSEKEQQEINNIIKKNSQELNKFIICDKIFGAYIHCINEFTIKHPDCATICNLLDTIHMCNIRTNPTTKDK